MTPERLDLLGTGILALAGLLLALLLVHHRVQHPLLGIVVRWLRWLLFGLGLGFIFYEQHWTDRPFWVLAVAGLGLWFLLETGYTWLMVKALSRSDIPLFPAFRINERGDEWPSDRSSILLREYLRSEGFQKQASLQADVGPGLMLRSSVFDQPDEGLRLQVLFIPRRNDAVVSCFILTTELEDDRRVITDNVFLPFGGYYPDNWELDRRPLRRRLPGLLKLHRQRVKATGVATRKPEAAVLDALNDQQRLLEKINTRAGFLFPRAERETSGKITQSGLTRIWMEIWLLNYFGRPVSY
ncbi:MAG: hypothetical protein ACFE0O_10110 [Opitutales bacterium]